MQQVFQRARRPEQRDDRRQDIINTALSVLAEQAFDLVLLDILLPSRDGRPAISLSSIHAKRVSGST